jgi:hypothetical protein
MTGKNAPASVNNVLNPGDSFAGAGSGVVGFRVVMLAPFTRVLATIGLAPALFV